MMKNRGIKDLYLPSKLAVHAKTFLFCLAFTPIWGLIIGSELNSIFLIGTFSIMFVDIEILLWIGRWFHNEGSKRKRQELTSHYLFGLFWFYLIAVIICTLTFMLFIIILHTSKGWGFPDFFSNPLLSHLLEVMKVTAIGLSLSIPIFFYGQWQGALKREQKLREQNLIFQNETLKNQVNPHFLFNSLNTLSSLVETQTEIAEQFINQLSSTYRYILENSNKDLVPLQDELDFIETYFYLHKIRDNGKIQLTIDVEHTDDHKVLPVSLQMLVENAIKHNMATREKPLIVKIELEDQFVVVSNNLQGLATKIESTGKGQANLNERLNLMCGKSLEIIKTNSNYTVKVPLIS